MKENTQIKREYFAGAVSKNGFKNYFKDVFAPEKLNKLYIIKGGSGTGKSAMIRKVANYFESLGMNLEYFCCAFDPHSLDGILIKEINCGIIDGTAPHVTDPIYPGAVEKIINVIENADEELLRENKENIISLTKEKSEHMKKASSYLVAFSQIKNEISDFCGIGLKGEKMRAAAKKFVDREISGGNDYNTKTRLISALGASGAVKLDTFENTSDKKCLIEDDFECAHHFLFEVLSHAKEKKTEVLVSYDTLTEKLNGLCFPNSSLSLTVDDRISWEKRFGEAYKYINMERFVDSDHIRKNRQKIRFERKCQAALYAGIESSFKDAMNVHLNIERIYGNAMDFSKNDLLCQNIIDDFKKLCQEQ